MKEVEHSKELNNNLYQRQLAAERRKTVSVLEENQTLRQMLEELTRKLRVSSDKDQRAMKHAAECAGCSGFALLISLEEGERTRCYEHLRQPSGEILHEKGHGEHQQTQR